VTSHILIFFFKNKEKGPMGVVEQCLGYWGGTIAAMAIAANSFNSDHQNYVCPPRTICLNMMTSMFLSSECGEIKGI